MQAPYDIDYNDFLKLLPASIYKCYKHDEDTDSDVDTDIKNLFTLYAERFNKLEEIVEQIANMKQIDTATGALLDRIGEIVKESRQGRQDDSYRKYLKIAIKRNVSNGSLETVSEITGLILEGTGFSNYTIEELHSLEEGTYFDAEEGVKEYPAFDGTWIMNPYLPRPAIFKVNVSGIDGNEDLKAYLQNTIDEIKAGGVEAIVVDPTTQVSS